MHIQILLVYWTRSNLMLEKMSSGFLKRFLSWVCDQCHGKEGWRCPGFKYTSSLKTFWKWYEAYKQEIRSWIDDLIIPQTQEVSEPHLFFLGHERHQLGVSKLFHPCPSRNDRDDICHWLALDPADSVLPVGWDHWKLSTGPVGASLSALGADTDLGPLSPPSLSCSFT